MYAKKAGFRNHEKQAEKSEKEISAVIFARIAMWVRHLQFDSWLPPDHKQERKPRFQVLRSRCILALPQWTLSHTVPS